MLASQWAGAGLIIGASTLLGWQVAAGYARRPGQLRELQTACAILQTEVEYATPLPAALSAAAGAVSEPVCGLLRAAARALTRGDGITPGEALMSAIQAEGRETALKQTDLAVLAALAPVLGISGRSDQVRHLQLARERLAGEEARAQEERNRYERVARYLGVLGGALVVMLLL
ncbi:MAG: hypothetical protein ACM3XM_10185 [Mycobacterium leprae]